MHIESKFDLGSHLKPLVGMKISPIYFKSLTIAHLSNELILSGADDFVVHFWDDSTNQDHYVSFKPVGGESIVGNLFGFEVKNLPTKNNKVDLSAYPTAYLLDTSNNTVEKIEIYGENGTGQIHDKDQIEFWFQSSTEMPDQISYEKKTALLIAIQFSAKKWVYFHSGGDNDYRIYCDIPLSPKEFVRQYNYKDNYEHFCLIEALE